MRKMFNYFININIKKIFEVTPPCLTPLTIFYSGEKDPLKLIQIRALKRINLIMFNIKLSK